jgi:hypothetical protein
MTIAVNDIIEIHMLATRVGQGVENVREYKVTAVTGGGPTLTECADAFWAELADAYKAAISDTYTLVRAIARQINLDGTGITDFFPNNVGEPQVGLLTGDAMPDFITGLISLRTGLAGRSKRGRFFVFAPTEEYNSAAGNPTNAYLPLLNAIGTALTTPLSAGAGGNTATLTPVVLSKAHEYTNPISSWIPVLGWSTRKSRRLRQ